MFGFQGGESAETVARKKGYMQSAQQRWSFLTTFDLSTIKTEAQLSSMVKERSGIPEAQAKSDVQAWVEGKQFWNSQEAPFLAGHLQRCHNTVSDCSDYRSTHLQELLSKPRSFIKR